MKLKLRRELTPEETARYLDRQHEQKMAREREERVAHVRRIREDKAERERLFREAEERRQAAADEAWAKVHRPRPVPIPPPVPSRSISPERWDEMERSRRDGEERERERTAQVEAERKAAADREQTAQRDWAEHRNELTAKVREAELAAQFAEADLRDAIGAGDVDRAGAATQKLKGARAIRDAAQTEVDQHQHLQPGKRWR
ncbi:MAG: hypothetical protein ACTHMY_18075 [Solirubrobacteraceae bacterium]